MLHQGCYCRATTAGSTSAVARPHPGWSGGGRGQPTRRAHRGDVLRRRAAAAADQVDADSCRRGRARPCRPASRRTRSGRRRPAGSPALDWATSSRPSGRASASCAGDRRHLLGAAAAVGADRVDAGRGERGDGVAGPDAHHRAQVGVEGQRGDHRQVGYDGPGGRHGGLRPRRGRSSSRSAPRRCRRRAARAAAPRRAPGPPRRSSCRAGRAAHRSGRGRRRRARRARRRPRGRSTPRPG